MEKVKFVVWGGVLRKYRRIMHRIVGILGRPAGRPPDEEFMHMLLYYHLWNVIFHKLMVFEYDVKIG